jgi:hypothetical protein
MKKIKPFNFNLSFSDISDLYELTLKYGLVGYGIARRTFEKIYQIPFSEAVKYFRLKGYIQKFKKEFKELKRWRGTI